MVFLRCGTGPTHHGIVGRYIIEWISEADVLIAQLSRVFSICKLEWLGDDERSFAAVV
jgi:hypothetical protein